jgi:ABC-type transporter Mla subunit MlaD
MADQLVDDEAPKPRKIARLTRVPGGRGKTVKVSMTDDEYLQVGARARVAGVSMQRLMIEAALASGDGTAGGGMSASERRGLIAEFTGARRLVAQVSNNINQLAKVANATGEIPAEFSATMHAAARLLNRLDAAAGQLSRGPERADD